MTMGHRTARPDPSFLRTIGVQTGSACGGKLSRPTADAVTLATLHAAKGLEWDAVCRVHADAAWHGAGDRDGQGQTRGGPQRRRERILSVTEVLHG